MCVCVCVYGYVPFTLMLLRSVIFISIFGNMQGLSGLLLLTYIFTTQQTGRKSSISHVTVHSLKMENLMHLGSKVK